MMEIRNAGSADEFAWIVDRVGRTHYAGNLKPIDVVQHRANMYTARVRAIDSGYQTQPHDTSYLAPGARRSWSGRRAAAACWHAYRDVLRELFRRYPDATVLTGRYWKLTYDGREGFEREYPRTAHINIGSQMQQTTMPELCDCPTGSDECDPFEHLEETNDYDDSQLGESFDLFPDITERLQAIGQELQPR